MNAGQLNKKVRIMNRQKINDGFGNDVEKAKPWVSVWANIKKTPSANENEEKFENDEIFNLKTYDITIRAINKLNTSMIISWQNKQYKIQFIDENEDKIVKDYYVLKCELMDHNLEEV